MKIIVLNQTNEITNYFPDSYEIAQLSNRTCVSDPANRDNDIDLASLNRNNSTVVEDVDMDDFLENFEGGKYTYVDGVVEEKE